MRSRTTLIILAAAVVAVIAGVAMFLHMARYGFSAHDEPTRMESVLAAMMRRYAVPAGLRDMQNPQPLTPVVMAEARAHFADHCASCHGNDGRGRTEMGQKFYPKVPDMTLAETQEQTDGALFATIENGIRLTGMPGWGEGTAESARGSWSLVHLIRHFPKITTREIEEMKAMNPISPAEIHEAKKEQTEEEQFLSGADEDSSPPTATQSHSH